MTKDELCICAAKYAVGKMTLGGSFGFITNPDNRAQAISWSEVVELLDNVINRECKPGYISIDDVMSVFNDYMQGDVNEDDTNTFLTMLIDKAESEEQE